MGALPRTRASTGALPWRTCGTTPSPTTPSPKARTRSAGTPPRRGPRPRTSRRCSPSTPSPTATAGSPGRCATCPGARWNSATARSAPTYPGCGPAGSARSSGRSRCPGDEGASLTRTLEQLDFARAVVAAHPGALRLARTSYDVADAHGRGRIAVVPGPADARGIDDSLAGLRTLAELGVRSLTLAGARWAGEEGLSVFGTEVVRETNRLGMLLDLTGAPAAVVARVLDISRAPALLRAGAAAVREHAGNAPDPVLAALGAARGLCLVPLTEPLCGPALADTADHIDHVRAVAGPGSVALCGAHDTGEAHPEGLSDPTGYPPLLTELRARGWSDAELTALTWENVVRVLKEADETARETSARRGPSTARLEERDELTPRPVPGLGL
ncbi:membrane dipeptidase [Streptomyces sp. SolWspMP-sol7th]|uniref:membrane dipeptidase n=2 Tax=unclassified Streptomyces TaxID=2593676 RepID=UPI0020C77B3C|nr:membrane dipeptidase [Streptomyces sp. SolWspMP-sol7th]